MTGDAGAKMNKHVLDTIGIPEFFANTVVLEYAGNGMIRAIYCSQRGMLVPVVTVIRPLTNVIDLAPGAMDLCRRLIREEMGAVH